MQVSGRNSVVCEVECMPDREHPFLDNCYVCDPFCTAARGSPIWNSHMTSLYVDLFMTAMIFVLRNVRSQDMKDLKLEEYFLSNLKMISVAGHGAAHWYLSFLSNDEKFNADVLGPAGLSILLGLMLGTAFIKPEQLFKLKGNFGGDFQVASVKDKQTLEKQTKGINFLGFFLAPFALVQGMSASAVSGATKPLGIVIFAAAACLFFYAGAPQSGSPLNDFKSAGLGALALTVISVIFVPPNDVKNDFGPGFTLIFSSAYIYSSFTQMFLWKERKDWELQEATSYACNAWLTAFLTACVGWALALKCSSLNKWVGHALYDFSIPLSYFLLYFVVKKFKVEKK